MGWFASAPCSLTWSRSLAWASFHGDDHKGHKGIKRGPAWGHMYFTSLLLHLVFGVVLFPLKQVLQPSSECVCVCVCVYVYACMRAQEAGTKGRNTVKCEQMSATTTIVLQSEVEERFV